MRRWSSVIELDALAGREREAVRGLLERLTPSERADLLRGASELGASSAGPSSERAVVLRERRAGDMGWIAERNAIYYAQACDFEDGFEATIAEITATFLRNYCHDRERCWIAELGGERVGCVFVARDSERVARLRLLLVEPRARGLGLGNRLVGTCVDFARSKGYEKLVLWTRNILTPARHVYASAGFVLVEETPHESLPGIVEESWELTL